MCREAARRIGVFLCFVTIALLFMFYLTTSSDEPAYILFYAGLLLAAITFLILRITKPPKRESQRFRTLRRLLSGRSKEENGWYGYEDEEEW